MTDFNDFLSEQMKDDEFRREYEALESEFQSMQAMIDGCDRSDTKPSINKPTNDYKTFQK